MHMGSQIDHTPSAPRRVGRGVCAGLLLLWSLVPVRADVAGSADLPNIGRYDGSEIVYYQQEALGKTTLAIGPVQRASDADSTSLALEGKLTRIVYRVPGGVSAFEVFRNFEIRIGDAGFETIFSGGPEQLDGYNFKYKHPVEILDETSMGNEIHYLAARKNIKGVDVHLSVLVSPHSGGDGQRVRVIGIESAALQVRMVAADAMALAIAETGRVSLYGIYFAHDSAAIEAASEPTLAEIGKFLQQNPAVNIIVVGHTDNSGGYDYNLQLSRERAAAVVERLVTGGAAQARLRSAGVGYLAPAASNDAEAGRALNRRVELVKDK